MPPDNRDILTAARHDMARRQLRALMAFLSLSLLILVAAGLILRDAEALYISAANMLVLGAVTWLRARDNLDAATMTISLALLVSAAWGTWTTPWGLFDSTAVVFVGAAVFGALLLPRRHLLVLLVLIVLAVLSVGLRVSLGLAPDNDLGLTRGIDVALVLIAVITVTVWVRRQNAMLWDTLERAVANERELAASHAALQERQEQALASEQRWRSLVTAAPDWVLQLDRDGVIVFANREGYFAEDPCGRHLTDVVDREHRGMLAGAVAAVVNDGVTRSMELPVPCPECPCHGLFHLGPLGDTSGAIVLVSDLTEHRRLQQQLLQTQKLDSIGQLAGGIAHDFNNLLTVIAGHADLAEAKLTADHPALADLETIQQTCDHATTLTRQILAFSRQQPLQTEPLDLAKSIRTMRRMLERLIGEDIRLEEDLARDLPLIEADPGSVEQVVMNLVVNARDAVRAADRGGERVIRLATRFLDPDAAQVAAPGGLHPGAYVEMSVTDTGIGMPTEVQARVFEPFFTTKETGRGTGLGLATVYGVATQSGGTVLLESEPGRGATFFVYWPVTKEGERPAETAAPESRRVAGDEHVLVVEDDDAVRRLAAAALRREGYQVTEACNGREALALVTPDHPFDLVFTDVVMPEVNGFELRDRLPAGLPVLFASGHTDRDLLPDGAMPPAEIFLRKPYLTRELAHRVRTLLDAARATDPTP